jgi:uncharacterized protein YndB with AHSA1/START domain
MAKIETSVEVNRPVEEVWEYMTDLRNAREWSTEVIDTVYSGPIQLGASGVDTRRMGRREMKWHWEITGYDPPRQLTLTYGPPLNAVANFSFEPTNGNGTLVSCTTTLSPTGWMRLISPLIAMEGRKVDQKQFTKVKAILEQM